jgi:hypothetical protein
MSSVPAPEQTVAGPVHAELIVDTSVSVAMSFVSDSQPPHKVLLHKQF